MQTKYSALVYAALVGVAAFLLRRRRDGVRRAVALAAALFVGWEAALVARYGQSHLLAGIERVRTLGLLGDVEHASGGQPGGMGLYWTLALFSLVGGTEVYAALLALVGLGVRRARVGLAALAAGLVFAAVLALPGAPAAEPVGLLATLAAFNPELVLFVPLGAGVAACVGAAALQLLRRRDVTDRRADRLLVAWLLLELVGYFVISPYPAVRRVIGLSIAATLLAARAAARRMPGRDAVAGARIATAIGLAIAALYFASELSDAWARRALVDGIAERLATLGASAPRETIWYTGHWEFQFYAERSGWRAVIPGASKLRRGDWLVIPANVDLPESRTRPAWRARPRSPSRARLPGRRFRPITPARCRWRDSARRMLRRGSTA